MNFVFYAWIASFSYGLTAIITKLTGKYSISNPWLLNFLLITFQLIITLPLALSNGVNVPTEWKSLTFAAFTYAFFGVFYIISLSKLDISIYIPLFNFRAIFGVLLGVLFLNEILTSLNLFLVLVIFVAGIFSSMDEKFKVSSFFQKQIFIGLISVLILALNGLFINQAIKNNDFWTVTLWQYILALIFLLPTIPKFKNEINKLNPKKSLAVLSIALSLLIGDLAANKAYENNLGLSSIIISLPFSMIITFILSFFYPKLLEKHTFKVYITRFSAAAVMIVSALKISNVF
jgi:drug/metabolite transporter (DMT)-like permease